MHGLDRAAAPSAAKAKEMLDEIGGSWWNVYIGGPSSGGSGWTPALLEEYKAHGIRRFLLTYVGRQDKQVHLLTANQGRKDGVDACQIAARFGYHEGTPICLDLEQRTFEAASSGSLDYVCAWCDAVRAQGLRPGLYANRPALVAVASRANRPDWVWVASWIGHSVDPGLHPHRIRHLDDGLWSEAGQRAWQYAGAFKENGVLKACRVGGFDVDINVADSECLAGEAGPPQPKLPSHLEEDDMFTFSSPGQPTFFVAGGRAVGLNELSDLQAIQAALKPAPLPDLALDADTFQAFVRAFRAD
jgi:hypothetical protein